MWKTLFSLLFVPLILADSDVLEFTDSTFDDEIKDHSTILVEFFAPWCGHCKRLAPEYEKAASRLKDNDPPVALAKVDCTESKATCDKFGVSGFPTLKIFRGGDFSADYGGPREADGIVKFMRGQVGASSKELKSQAEFDKFTGSDDHSVVGFFAKDSPLKEAFHKVADSQRESYRFAHTSDSGVLDKLSFKDNIVIFQPKRLHNKFESAETKYDGSDDVGAIKKFFETQMQGLCGHRTMDNTASFEKPLVVAYYNVDYVKDPKGTNYWRNRVLKVAKDFPAVTFAVSSKTDFSHELEEHGLGDRSEEDKPLVAGQGKDGGKYPMKGEFSMDNLKQFVQDLLDNKLEKHMKSEAVPETQGDVKVLVAKNFDEIIDGSSDALVEFYAPWCGHCKKLTPIYEELGENLKDEDVVIAKMDATANDVPSQFQVQGFPTLFWIPKGQEPRSYQGGRELKDFMKYIAKESTDGLKGFSRDGKKTKAKKEL